MVRPIDSGGHQFFGQLHSVGEREASWSDAHDIAAAPKNHLVGLPVLIQIFFTVRVLGLVLIFEVLPDDPNIRQHLAVVELRSRLHDLRPKLAILHSFRLVNLALRQYALNPSIHSLKTRPGQCSPIRFSSHNGFVESLHQPTEKWGRQLLFVRNEARLFGPKSNRKRHLQPTVIIADI